MLVCHCRVVSDRAVRAVIGEGVADLDEVMDRCGLGGDCGGCLPAVEDLLADAALAVRSPVGVATRQRQRRHHRVVQPA